MAKKQSNQPQKAAAKAVDTEKPGKVETVTVNQNRKGEAKAGTTETGQKDTVQNTESIPQNGVTKIETTPPPNEIAKKADAARTKDEIKFADESNPNQKGRFNGAPTPYDQDSNERSGGKSYGVSLDQKPAPEVVEQNKGEAPKEPKKK